MKNKQIDTQERNFLGRSHAIVVGGSLAGLLTARVLADHFAEVSVVERDALNDDTNPRPGVPQSRHLHAMLPRGMQIIENFIPGIREELLAAGAVPLDIADDIAWLTPQGWGIRFRSGLEGLSFTRDLLDYIVRRRIRKVGNVRLLDQRIVTGLLAQPGSVSGVRTLDSTNQSRREEHLHANLVVVAAGRQQALARWFAEIGLQSPELTKIDAHIGYASRMYRRRKQSTPAWKALILQTAPPEVNRSGLIFPVEGDRWLVTLIGADRDYPPGDEAGFVEFARSLRSPALYETIREAEPLTPIRPYRATENRQLHLERIRNWPQGLIVIGDAACAFNPVYGQGMSTAAIETTRLDELLRQGNIPNLCAKFQQEVPRIIRDPWTLATSADLRFRSVEGAKADWGTRVMHWYVDQVLRLATTDVWARNRFLEVQGMLRDTSAILRPDMLWRVLKNLRPRTGVRASETRSLRTSQRTPVRFSSWAPEREE